MEQSETKIFAAEKKSKQDVPIVNFAGMEETYWDLRETREGGAKEDP